MEENESHGVFWWNLSFRPFLPFSLPTNPYHLPTCLAVSRTPERHGYIEQTQSLRAQHSQSGESLCLPFSNLQSLFLPCVIRNHFQQELWLSCALHTAVPNLWLSAQLSISLTSNFSPFVITQACYQFLYTFISDLFYLRDPLTLFNYNMMM